MGLLDWLRRRGKKPKEEKARAVDEEKEALERTGKLRTEIEEHVKEKPKRKREKKKEGG